MTKDECLLCPRMCKVNRKNEIGFCGVKGENIAIGRVSLHMWEEPCISGENGSGTIFFAGCNLKCLYCQNKVLSRCTANARYITTDELARCMLSLQQKGAHNINLVTPTHYSDQIIQAVAIARANGLNVPIVYNTSGYERAEIISKLSDTVSIYLTDFKYSDDALAVKFSGVRDYFEFASQSLAKMVEQTGKPVFDSKGMLIRGTIVRHLVLPGHINQSKDVLEYLHRTYGSNIIISIMNQYTPVEKLPYAELNRRVTKREYESVIDFAMGLGIQNAFIQEDGTQQQSFIPEFNGEGIE